MHKEEEREHKALMTPPSTDCSADDCPLAAGAVVQRKQRSKRRRHPSPSPPTASSASSSESTTTEEEDMAHCLILLAQGGGRAHAAVDSPPSQPAPAPAQPQQQPLIPAASTVKTERYTSRKYTEAAATADGAKAGFYVYECKTCNKCFPSFQALGGHRASHKKQRVTTAAEENMTTTAANTAANAKKPSPSPPPPSPDTTAVITLSLTTGAGVGGSNNKLTRVHECSICGAEFASGQALGGHMRRHRPLNAPEGVVTAVPTAAVEEKKERSINLELDLNMPAPSDEAAPEPAPTTFGQFDGKKGALMHTASALVDCHY